MPFRYKLQTRASAVNYSSVADHRLHFLSLVRVAARQRRSLQNRRRFDLFMSRSGSQLMSLLTGGRIIAAARNTMPTSARNRLPRWKIVRYVEGASCSDSGFILPVGLDRLGFRATLTGAITGGHLISVRPYFRSKTEGRSPSSVQVSSAASAAKVRMQSRRKIESDRATAKHGAV